MNKQSWDEYFYNICNVVASNSKCLSRKIGSVLVRDKRVVSVGYNGPPSGVRPCDERWFCDDKLVETAGFQDLNLHNKSEKYINELKGKCPRYIKELGFKSGQGLELCVAGHAERNSLINAARNGIATKGCKLYMNCGIPCTPCMVEIINAGIEEIIVTKIEYYDVSSEYLLKESGIKYRVFDHLKDRQNDGEY